MLNRVKELHYEYCAPKPVRHFTLWDSDISAPLPVNDIESASIDIFIHVIA